MKKRKNILFSTTRQWNPGDEFILKGVLKVFRSIDAGFNPVIFNRNPEIKHPESRRSFDFHLDVDRLRAKRLKPGSYDNSFKKELSGDDFVDLVVFAGTPEWASARMKVLYDYIERHGTPTIYLGIGVGGEDFNWQHLDAKFRNIMKKSLLITVRDRLAEKALAALKPVYLPCPALLSAPEQYERWIDGVRKVGLIYGTSRGVRSNRINATADRFLFDLYQELLRKYRDHLEFELICHYVNELPECARDFPETTCLYSYDSAEYADIYHHFDMVVGPRVHGIGIAASMGIPGLNVRHDARGDTCYGFGADVIGADGSMEKALSIFEDKLKHVGTVNRALLAEKRRVFDVYIRLLKPVLQNLDMKTFGP